MLVTSDHRVMFWSGYGAIDLQCPFSANSASVGRSNISYPLAAGVDSQIGLFSGSQGVHWVLSTVENAGNLTMVDANYVGTSGNYHFLAVTASDKGAIYTSTQTSETGPVWNKEISGIPYQINGAYIGNISDLSGIMLVGDNGLVLVRK